MMKLEKSAVFRCLPNKNLNIYEDAKTSTVVGQINPGESFMVITEGEVVDYSGCVLWVLGPERKGCLVLFKADIEKLERVS